ncbi:MAG: 1-acyl-sn-glycerol-3-phosphate acyltransferase [Oscillospiraceae bacterium]|nr:1-acyl-sn-glycerol-3-phosphate acyltransferase [Oscillospiraceae bacterium]
MILGNNRPAVIENIAAAAESSDFYAKVELDDPTPSPEECRAFTQRFLAQRHSFSQSLRTAPARLFANWGSDILNRSTEYVINGDLSALEQGCFLTSNHFCPLENTILRAFVRKHGKKKLNVISQMCNFFMKGPLGYLLRNADTIPLLEEPRYLAGEFLTVLTERFAKEEPVLIYPEQEMWFNYRKPRPPKRGAYYFAAKLNVPVMCCFVQIIDLPGMDTKDFHKVRYVLHVLDTLYPDPEKSARQNSFDMSQKDMELKRAAYEACYGKKLTYDFDPSDIAGWKA